MTENPMDPTSPEAPISETSTPNPRTNEQGLIEEVDRLIMPIRLTEADLRREPTLRVEIELEDGRVVPRDIPCVDFSEIASKIQFDDKIDYHKEQAQFRERLRQRVAQLLQVPSISFNRATMLIAKAEELSQPQKKID